MSTSRHNHGNMRRDFLASALAQAIENDRSGEGAIPQDFTIVSMDDDLVVYSSGIAPEDGINRLQRSLTDELGYNIKIKRFCDNRY